MCGRFAFFAKGQFGYESLQLPRTTPGRAVQHRAVPGHPRDPLLTRDRAARMGHAPLGTGAILVQRIQDQAPAHQRPGRGGRDQALLPRACAPSSLYRPGKWVLLSGAARVQANSPISCALLRMRSLPWPASGTAGKANRERLSSPWLSSPHRPTN